MYYMMLWFKSMGCVLVRHIYFTKRVYIYIMSQCVLVSILLVLLLTDEYIRTYDILLLTQQWWLYVAMYVKTIKVLLCFRATYM